MNPAATQAESSNPGSGECRCIGILAFLGVGLWRYGDLHGRKPLFLVIHDACAGLGREGRDKQQPSAIT
jgi:hypothetical protein